MTLENWRSVLQILGALITVSGAVCAYSLLVVNQKINHRDKTPKPVAEAMDISVPGMALHFQARLLPGSADSRRYLFDFGRINGERFSVYVSRDNIFTISFVDAKGEPHNLALPIGTKSLPVGAFTHLGCELGIDGQTTTLRLVRDGEKVGELTLPFRTDIGALNINGGTVGANLDGMQGASFDVTRILIYGATLSSADRKQFKAALDGKPTHDFTAFRGTGFGRVGQFTKDMNMVGAVQRVIEGQPVGDIGPVDPTQLLRRTIYEELRTNSATAAEKGAVLASNTFRLRRGVPTRVANNENNILELIEVTSADGRTYPALSVIGPAYGVTRFGTEGVRISLIQIGDIQQTGDALTLPLVYLFAPEAGSRFALLSKQRVVFWSVLSRDPEGFDIYLEERMPTERELTLKL